MAVVVFHLQRDKDVSGISGTGKVAEGIEFSDGTVVVHWLSHTSSTTVYENMKQVDTIHGHDGATRVIVDFEG